MLEDSLCSVFDVIRILEKTNCVLRTAIVKLDIKIKRDSLCNDFLLKKDVVRLSEYFYKKDFSSYYYSVKKIRVVQEFLDSENNTTKAIATRLNVSGVFVNKTINEFLKYKEITVLSKMNAKNMNYEMD